MPPSTRRVHRGTAQDQLTKGRFGVNSRGPFCYTGGGLALDLFGKTMKSLGGRGRLMVGRGKGAAVGHGGGLWR